MFSNVCFLVFFVVLSPTTLWLTSKDIAEELSFFCVVGKFFGFLEGNRLISSYRFKHFTISFQNNIWSFLWGTISIFHRMGGSLFLSKVTFVHIQPHGKLWDLYHFPLWIKEKSLCYLSIEARELSSFKT